jgi:hypothetical protein
VPRTAILQTNFSAGELSPDLGMRQDTEQYQNGAKSLHNRRCLIGGGAVRAPGSWKLIDLPGRARLVRFIVNRTTQYVVAFGEERADFYARNVTTGRLTAAGSVTSAPWTDGIWQEMIVVQSGNTMFLTHTDMAPQVIVRTGAATWSRSAFAFFTGPASRLEQPYLKFAADAKTLTASDVTGSVTLTISGSDAYFVSDHVGTYIRYHKKACLITAVAADGLSCTATVIERLPETYDLTVGSSAIFAVGEAVEGSSTGATGIITAILDATSIVVVLTNTHIQFATSDTFIGPNGKTDITGSTTATNAAVTDWDEQMFSAVYGYPACVELHRNRLLFAGHLSAPNYLIASELGNLYSFNVGDGSDGDAILESIGDDAAARIVQMHSAEQLLVLTDSGPYYVPEGVATPFRPSSFAFFPFGSPWPVSETCRPEPFDGGVLFVSGSLVIKASPTGDLNQAWSADEKSLIAAHLFKTPTELTIITRFSGGPERYAVFRNDDGTLAVMQLIETQNVRNVTPWETDRETDTYESVLGIEGDLYTANIRSIAGNTVYTLELFDQDITLACATEFTDLDDVPATYGTTTVNVVTDSGLHLGTYPPALDTLPVGPYTVGLNYDSEIELFPPVIDGREGSKSGDEMRIIEANVHVLSSARFGANGYELTAYQATDDLTANPPLKNGAQRFQFLGWQREPTLRITQTDPLPLKVLGIRTVVAY